MQCFDQTHLHTEPVAADWVDMLSRREGKKGGKKTGNDCRKEKNNSLLKRYKYSKSLLSFANVTINILALLMWLQRQSFLWFDDDTTQIAGLVSPEGPWCVESCSYKHSPLLQITDCDDVKGSVS